MTGLQFDGSCKCFAYLSQARLTVLGSRCTFQLSKEAC